MRLKRLDFFKYVFLMFHFNSSGLSPYLTHEINELVKKSVDRTLVNMFHPILTTPPGASQRCATRGVFLFWGGVHVSL